MDGLTIGCDHSGVFHLRGSIAELRLYHCHLQVRQQAEPCSALLCPSPPPHPHPQYGVCVSVAATHRLVVHMYRLVVHMYRLSTHTYRLSTHVSSRTGASATESATVMSATVMSAHRPHAYHGYHIPLTADPTLLQAAERTQTEAALALRYGLSHAAVAHMDPAPGNPYRADP